MGKQKPVICRWCSPHRRFAHAGLLGMHTKHYHPLHWRGVSRSARLAKIRRDTRRGLLPKQPEVSKFLRSRIPERIDRFAEAMKAVYEHRDQLVKENFDLRRRLEAVTVALAKAGIAFGGQVTYRPVPAAPPHWTQTPKGRAKMRRLAALKKKAGDGGHFGKLPTSANGHRKHWTQTPKGRAMMSRFAKKLVKKMSRNGHYVCKKHHRDFPTQLALNGHLKSHAVMHAPR